MTQNLRLLPVCLLFTSLWALSAVSTLTGQGCDQSRSVVGQDSQGQGNSVVGEGAPPPPLIDIWNLPEEVSPLEASGATSPSKGNVDGQSGRLFFTEPIRGGEAISHNSYLVGSWNDSVANGGPRLLPPGPGNGYGNSWDSIESRLESSADGGETWPENWIMVTPSSDSAGSGRVRYAPVGLPTNAQAYYLTPIGNEAVHAVEYQNVSGPWKVSLEWAEDNGVVTRARAFVRDRQNIVREFEGYSGSIPRQMKWRLIRSFKGSYSSPYWEETRTYDAGHEGLATKTDYRGVTTTYTWTDLGTSLWRITKHSYQAPWGTPPSISNWSDLDVAFEYSSQGYLERIIWPQSTVTQDKNVLGTMDPPLSLKRSHVYVYDSSGRLITLKEDIDGATAATVGSETGLRQLSAFEYQSSPNPTWRLSKQHVSIAVLGITNTYSYGTDPTYGDYVEQTDPNQNTLTTYYADDANLGVLLASLPESRMVTRIVKTDGTSVRPSGFHKHSSLTWIFEYSACSCGALQKVIRPDGVMIEYTRDSQDRGLPVYAKVTGAGGSPVKHWYWEWEDWDHSDVRIASRLKKVTDPRGHITEYLHSVQSGAVHTVIKEGSTSSMVTIQTLQENNYERFVWSEEASVSIDSQLGGGTTGLRREYIYGVVSTNADYRLVMQSKQVHGSSSLVTNYTYNGFGFLWEITNPIGAKTKYTRDEYGRIITVERTKPSGASLEVVASFAWDRNGQLSIAKRKATKADGTAYAKAWVEQQLHWNHRNQMWLAREDRGSLGVASPSWYETDYDYSKLGLLVQIEGDNGSKVEFLWDGYGQLYKAKHKLNATDTRETQYGWDPNGFPRAVVNSDGQTAYLDPDSLGRLMRRVLPDGQKFEYNYDIADRLEWTKHYTGTTHHSTTTNTYNATHNRLEKTESVIAGASSGRSVDITYNGLTRASKIEDQDGRKISTYYDKYGRLARKSDDLISAGSGNMVTLTLDNLGLPSKVVTTEQEHNGGSSYSGKTFQVEYVRDNWGRITKARDFGETTSGVPSGPLTETLRYFDSLNQLVQLVGPPTQASGADVSKTDLDYDALGRIVKKVMYPRTGSGSITLLTAFNDAPTGTNPYGKIVTRNDGRGNVSSYSYDQGGRLIQRVLPGANSGTKTWTYSYDKEDRILQWVDGNGATVKYGYDSLKRPDRRYLGSAGAQALSIMCTNETFAYDTLSRANQVKTFQYVWPTGTGPDPSASLHVQVDWSLDALGRKTSEVLGYGDNGAHAPAFSKTFTSTWTYGTNQEDFGFRRGLGTSNGFTYAFTPDAIGRPSNTSLTGNGLSGLSLVDYRYIGSRPVNRQHRLWSGSNRFETTYSYTAQRYLSQLETKYGTGIPADPVIFSQTLVRDLVGKILEDQQGLVGGAVGNKYSYDPYDRLQKAELGVSTFGSNPTVTKTVDYALDNAQNRTSVTETVGGTPTTTSYAVASNSNEYSSVGSNLYTYDGNGNLISDGFYYYVYDYLDRLSEVYVITYPAGATSSTSTRIAVFSHEIQKARLGKPTKVTPGDAKRLLGVMRSRVQKELARLKKEASSIKNTKDLKINTAVNQELTSTVDDYVLEFVAWYGYDSFNRRVSKISLYESAWYGYDDWRLLEEYDGGGIGSVSYFDGNGIDEHLGMSSYDGISWSNYAFAQDQIGNVVRVMDSTGAVIARFEYDAYGKRTLAQGSPGFNVAYGHTGRYHDIETDLIYYRNRYYSPSDGRFITQDPIGIWGDGIGWGNGYGYVGNMPVLLTDPSGLGWWAKLKALWKYRSKTQKIAKIAKKMDELKERSRQLKKGIETLRTQILKHKKKMKEYMANPLAGKHDKSGQLKRAMECGDKELALKIYNGRIVRIKKDLRKQGKEIKKKRDQLKETADKIKSLGKERSLLAGGAGLLFVLATPRQVKIESRWKKGEVVPMGEVYGATVLDLIGIVDPGIMDLLGF